MQHEIALLASQHLYQFIHRYQNENQKQRPKYKIKQQWETIRMPEVVKTYAQGTFKLHIYAYKWYDKYYYDGMPMQSNCIHVMSGVILYAKSWK